MDKQELMEKLMDLVDEKEIESQFKMRYFEEIHKEERHETLVKKALEVFDTLEAAFERIIGDEEFKIINFRVEEIRDILIEVVNGKFDHLEESFMAAVAEKMDIEPLREDPGFFEPYDEYKKDLLSVYMKQSPHKLYEEGKGLLSQDQKASIMTEQEIALELIKSTDVEHIKKRLAEEFVKMIDEGQQYELVIDEEVGGYEAGDGILMDKGKFDLEEYLDVYPFMAEYTGRRVSHVALEDGEGEDFSYWTTYEEHFRKLLDMMIMDKFQTVLEEFNNSRYSEYSILMQQLHIEGKQHLDAQEILKRSPLIYNELNEFQEQIWFNFVSSPSQEIYSLGKEGSI